MSYSSSREAGFSPGAGGILSQRLPGAVVVHVSTFPSVLGHWEISAESYAADGRCAQLCAPRDYAQPAEAAACKPFAFACGP